MPYNPNIAELSKCNFPRYALPTEPTWAVIFTVRIRRVPLKKCRIGNTRNLLNIIRDKSGDVYIWFDTKQGMCLGIHSMEYKHALWH